MSLIANDIRPARSRCIPAGYQSLPSSSLPTMAVAGVRFSPASVCLSVFSRTIFLQQFSKCWDRRPINSEDTSWATFGQVFGRRWMGISTPALQPGDSTSERSHRHSDRQTNICHYIELFIKWINFGPFQVFQRDAAHSHNIRISCWSGFSVMDKAPSRLRFKSRFGHPGDSNSTEFKSRHINYLLSDAK